MAFRDLLGHWLQLPLLSVGTLGVFLQEGITDCLTTPDLELTA